MAAQGDADRLLELLAGWAYAKAGSDLARSDTLTAVWGHVANSRRAVENYAIVPLASSGPMDEAVDIVVARRLEARGMSWFGAESRRSSGSGSCGSTGPGPTAGPDPSARSAGPGRYRPESAQRMGCFPRGGVVGLTAASGPSTSLCRDGRDVRRTHGFRVEMSPACVGGTLAAGMPHRGGHGPSARCSARTSTRDRTGVDVCHARRCGPPWTVPRAAPTPPRRRTTPAAGAAGVVLSRLPGQAHDLRV
jgi:hypothetical protein